MLAPSIYFVDSALGTAKIVVRSEIIRGFINPPASSRLFVRWWWNGNLIKLAELQKQQTIMKPTSMNDTKIKAVVFDLDGTLVDTVRDLSDAMNHALRSNARPEVSVEQCATMIGNGLRKFVERALGDSMDQLVEKVMRDMLSYYLDHCTVNSTVYPGISELIDSLASSNVSIAVLTNKGQQAAEAIVSHYFPDTFKHIAGAANGNSIKPEPKALLNLLERLKVKPEDTLMIGDSQPDIQVALASGVTPIGVTWGFRSAIELKQAGAQIIVDSPKEILEYMGII